MAVYKCTLFFNSGVTGWTESYYGNAGTPADAYEKAYELAKKRLALCGVPVDLPHIRVSDLEVRGDAIIDERPGLTTDPDTVAYTQIKGFSADEAPDVSWTAAKFTLAKDNIAVGRFFARGLPDAFFRNSRVFIPNDDWRKAFSAYAKLIKDPANGWGVNRKPKSTPANTFKLLDAFTVVDTGLKLKVANPFVIAAGNKVSVRGLKSNFGTLNGTFLVTEVVGQFVVLAKEFPGTQPEFVPNTGKVQVSTIAFISGLDVTFKGQATSRKVGRPFGSPAGRRKMVLLLK